MLSISKMIKMVVLLISQELHALWISLDISDIVIGEMLYDEYSNRMAKTAGLGISDMMFKQLSTKRPEI